MIEKRTVLTAFQAKPTESANIKKVAKYLDIGVSEYIRILVLKDVTKQLKKMKSWLM